MDTVGIVRTFTNEDKLIQWLEDRKMDFGSQDAFKEWLSLYYLEGNKIEANGKLYGYAECMELV